MRAATLNLTADKAMEERQESVEKLLPLNRQAYHLALRVLRSPAAAEDAVQQAFLNAMKTMPAGLPPEEARLWFLRVTGDAARKILRTELRRKRREVAVTADREEAVCEAGPDAELVLRLRSALDELDEKYRLPVALCCEQGLTRREVSAILDIPESNVSLFVREGLARLRKALAAAGYTTAPAAVLGALAHTGPAVPATLAAAVGKIVSGQVTAVGSGAGSAGAAAGVAAKGGIAMKIIVSVVAAGVLAGAAGLSAFGFRPFDRLTALSIVEGLSEPRDTGDGPAAAAADGTPAPVNPYAGMQEREEVFEFAEKPKVTKNGEKWTITFASKGKCDATVAMVDKDGKIVRHLASGVLGVNAPHPFQQGSLAQKLEWDGQTDDFKKAPAGCKVKVSLGLKPEYERNIMQPPHNFVRGNKAQVATDKDGNTCVAVIDGNLVFGHVYDKAGKYLRAFWPPPAKDVEKIGVKLTTTKWGDKTPWSGWFGPFVPNPKEKATATVEAFLAASGLAPQEFKAGPWPANLPKSNLSEGAKGEVNFNWFQKWGMFWVDPATKMIFSRVQVLPMREETGEIVFDHSLKGGGGRGFDGLYYGEGDWWHRGFRRWTGVGPWDMKRPDVTPPSVKYVPWKASGEDSLPLGILGSNGGCPCSGTDVTETGDIVGQFMAVILDETDMAKLKAMVKYTESPQVGIPKAKELGFKFLPQGEYILVWDKDGNARTRNAIENLGVNTSAFMDRDGNIYTSLGAALPPGQEELHGVAECPGKPRAWGGSILKFRGLGNKYPLGRMYGKHIWASKDAPPADALKLDGRLFSAASGALWAYGGISNVADTGCECNLSGFHLDHWARLWVPNNAVCGVMVVDSNGNFVMRVGQYGNLDDEGPRFAYIRSVWATDEALYVYDMANARLSKIALKYAAEETVPLP